MILTVSWRNIWRNPTRSLIVMGALLVGMFSGVFTSTFMNGWMKQRIRDGVETEVSHLRIQSPEFKKSGDFEDFFTDISKLESDLFQNPNVNGVSPRLSIQTMIASAETATGVQLFGVDPDKESQVINISEKVIEGKWFEGVKRNPIIIGQKLAEKLKVKLRSKVVITIQDKDGNIVSAAFRIAGIYKTINTTFDEMNVWAKLSDIQNLTLLHSDVAHEILVHTNNYETINEVVDDMSAKHPELSTLSWQKFSPEFAVLTEMGNMYLYIFVIIILLALGFGIVNTMLMVVLERIHELGMLMAVGMNKRRVFSMIMIETLILSVIGGFAGIICGIWATDYFGDKGIDLSIWSEGLEEWGYSAIIYPEYDWTVMIIIAFLVVLTGIIAAIYPSYRALKLAPAEAIRVI
ncbi:MAG: ABC transporter permease [Marinilabiliaceae bacterium]|nr:ABC transporter permease [Marinilabiliaceae bacterium]